MKLPDMEASFTYYGFMLATQTSVGNRSPSEVLFVLGVVLVGKWFLDLQEGDVINWYPNQLISPDNYEHTDIIFSVRKDGYLVPTNEMPSKEKICAKYNRSLIC